MKTQANFNDYEAKINKKIKKIKKIKKTHLQQSDLGSLTWWGVSPALFNNNLIRYQ